MGLVCGAESEPAADHHHGGGAFWLSCAGEERAGRACGEPASGISCAASLRIGLVQFPGLFAAQLCAGARAEASSVGIAIEVALEVSSAVR